MILINMFMLFWCKSDNAAYNMSDLCTKLEMVYFVLFVKLYFPAVKDNLFSCLFIQAVFFFVLN